jgi:hypothetical protein
MPGSRIAIVVRHQKHNRHRRFTVERATENDKYETEFTLLTVGCSAAKKNSKMLVALELTATKKLRGVAGCCIGSGGRRSLGLHRSSVPFPVSRGFTRTAAVGRTGRVPPHLL